MTEDTITTVNIPYFSMLAFFVSPILIYFTANPIEEKRTKKGSHLNNISSATAHIGIKNNEFVNSEVLATFWLN